MGKYEDLPGYESYCSILNLVDYMALHKVGNDDKEALYYVLDTLFSKYKDEVGYDCEIRDLADANDCYAETWEEFVKGFRKLWKEGKRVVLKYLEDGTHESFTIDEWKKIKKKK